MSPALQEPATEPEQSPDAEREDPPTRVQALDFSQPTKFTAELRRRISRVLSPFCKALATRMATDLRAPVELRALDARQLSWSAARAELPEDSLLVAVQAQPIGRQMLLAFELPLVLRSLDCLLGGSATSAPQARKLSEIDWALTRRLLDSIVLQLSLVWRDLGNIELSVGEVDLEGDAGMLVPIGEPTYAIAFEWEIAGLCSTFSLLLPWSAIEPVAAEIVGSGAFSQDGDPHEAGAIRRGLAAAKVLLRAEIGSSSMPVERVLALEPGSLLTLDARAEHGVTLLAENVPLALGIPGRSGARRAIKLTTPIEPASELSMRTLPGTANQDPAGPAESTHATLEGLARLRGVDTRVWAELGRTHMSLSDALRLPEGIVVELDEGAEDAVELFVNGLRFASGLLAVSDDGEWAVQIASLS